MPLLAWINFTRMDGCEGTSLDVKLPIETWNAAAAQSVLYGSQRQVNPLHCATG
jgi:hypothetical protein